MFLENKKKEETINKKPKLEKITEKNNEPKKIKQKSKKIKNWKMKIKDLIFSYLWYLLYQLALIILIDTLKTH